MALGPYYQNSYPIKFDYGVFEPDSVPVLMMDDEPTSVYAFVERPLKVTVNGQQVATVVPTRDMFTINNVSF